MAFQTDIPPHKSAEASSKPPPVSDPHPNTAMLKADINTGSTGDKVAVFDPGMAMLGTCEEAGGASLTPAQIKFAREQEVKHRFPDGRPKHPSADKDDGGARYGYVGLIAVAGAFMGSGIFWLG